MNITEARIAAQMAGLNYGEWHYRCEVLHIIEPPPLSEIRKRMVKPKYHTDGAKGSRPVCQYDLDGEFVCSYETIYTAAAAMGREKPYNIIAACEGRYLKAYGFQWRYMGEEAPGALERKKVNPAAQEYWEEKPCKTCGKMYKGPKNSRYCSGECKAEAGRKWQRKYYAGLEKKPKPVYTRRCAYCGAEFTTDIKKKIYCNDKCTNRASSQKQKERNKAQNRK